MSERLNILLVDDSDQEYARINNLLKEIKRWQFNLERVSSYETAVEKIARSRQTVCLVNPHLSQSSGLQELHQKFADTTAPPVVLLTTPDDTTAPEKVMTNGAVDYLVKGEINVSSLERSIRYALKYNRLKDKLEEQFQQHALQLIIKSKQLQKEVIDLQHQMAVRQEKEQQYRELFEVDIYGVEVLDINGVIVDCNTTYERMLGYSREEILGQASTTFASGYGAKRLKKKLALLNTRGYTEGEIELVCKDSSMMLVWRRFRALYNEDNEYTGAVTYSRDITDRMKAVRQISSLARALEQSPIAIMITDENGVVEYINFRFTEITGYTYEETIGQNLRNYKTPDDDAEIFLDIWRTIKEGDEWQGEFLNINKEGESYWESLIVAPMYDPQGNVTNFIAAHDDVTERKQNEEAAMASQRRVGDLMSEHINDLTSANEELQREISERKRAEKALQRSRARLKAQYKGIPVPTYTWQKAGDDFVLVDYNDAAEQDSQRRIADFMGKPVKEVFKDNPQVISDFARCFTQKTTVKREAPYTLVTTGEKKYFVTTYNFVPPHLVIVHIQDITEHKQTEEKLGEVQSELEQYRQRVETLPPSNGQSDPTSQEGSGELQAALEHEIAQREKAEKALKDQEERLKEIAGNIDERLREQYRGIPIPTYSWQHIAGEFILVDFNNAAAESMGKIVDFFGKPASEIFKSRPEILADFETCYNEKRTLVREAPYTMITTGETRFFVTTYHYVPPNMVIDHIQDITEYKQIEAELEDYRQQYGELAAAEQSVAATPSPDIGAELATIKEELETERAERQKLERTLAKIKTKTGQLFTSQVEQRVQQRVQELASQNKGLQESIAEHRQLQEQLEKTRSELEAQYKGIPLPTYTWRRVDDDFILMDYNEAAEKSSQGRINSFKDKPAGDIFKDRPQVLADFNQCYTERRLVRREAPYRLVTTGEIRQFVTTYNFVPPDTIIVHIEDVTEYKQVEEALQISEEQIELNCRLSPEMTLTFVNDAYCWYFNQHREDILGQQLPFVLDEDWEKVSRHFNTLSQNNPVGAIEYRVRKPDGSIHWQRWITRAIYDELERLVEFRSNGRDITRRKKEEAQKQVA